MYHHVEQSAQLLNNRRPHNEFKIKQYYFSNKKSWLAIQIDKTCLVQIGTSIESYSMAATRFWAEQSRALMSIIVDENIPVMERSKARLYEPKGFLVLWARSNTLRAIYEFFSAYLQPKTGRIYMQASEKSQFYWQSRHVKPNYLTQEELPPLSVRKGEWAKVNFK